MSGISFQAMSFMFRIRDIFRPPGQILEGFGIKEGMTLVDYGCGPGSNIRKASELAGEKGLVYAVDIHEMAIESVQKMVINEGLSNMAPVLAHGYDSGLREDTADIVFALDIFHMIQDPDAFLAELRRILKPEGVLIIDDGHQKREQTRDKILESGLWNIEKETDLFLRCSIARESSKC